MSDNILHKTEYYHYKLKIDSNKGPLELKWSAVEDLLYWNTIQSGLFLKGPGISLQLFFESFPEFNQYFWKQREELGVFDLPSNAKIIDIGCGTSVVDMLLAAYLPGSTFWLIDKEGWTFEEMVYYSETYPNYHSWDPVRDCINTTGFKKERFHLQSPTDQFPKEVDCIMSSFSWCFHYPKEKYWNTVLESLKIGGKLMLDVRLLEDRNIIDEISDEFGFEAKKIPIPAIPKHIDSFPNKDNITGYRCLWIRNK